MEPKLLHEFPDNPGDEHKAISPLRRMLMELTMDATFAFLHQMHLRYMVKSGKDSCYRANVQGYRTVRYSGVSNKSAHSALADALAKFLIHEQQDYHEYSIVNDPNADGQAS